MSKNRIFAPLLESILNVALEGEMDAHLTKNEFLKLKKQWGEQYPIVIRLYQNNRNKRCEYFHILQPSVSLFIPQIPLRGIAAKFTR